MEQLRQERSALMVESRCTICFRDRDDGVNVDTVLVPCGHVFCSECAAQLRDCSICRTRIEKRQRFYR